jgi:hypothetical protein
MDYGLWTMDYGQSTFGQSTFGQSTFGQSTVGLLDCWTIDNRQSTVEQ